MELAGDSKIIRHQWDQDVCTNCGLIRETKKVGTTYVTEYFDRSGKLMQPRECSGKHVAKNVVLT